MLLSIQGTGLPPFSLFDGTKSLTAARNKSFQHHQSSSILLWPTIEEILIAERDSRNDANLQNRHLRSRRQICAGVTTHWPENCTQTGRTTQWSVKTPALSGDNTSVTLVCSGALVITRSRMLLPRVGVWLICVKKWACNASINGSWLSPEALSTESQEMCGKLLSPQITIFWNWSQTWSRKMLNKYTQLGSESGGL